MRYSGDSNFFVDEYNLDIPKREDNVVKMIYFAFTTLSSVGFGDIRPYHTVERYFMIIIFLFTLTVFSAVLGNMQALFSYADEIYGSNGDPGKLERFFAVLVRYNNYLPLRGNVMKELEDYFQYYWANDRMAFISNEADQKILDELPIRTRLEVMRTFLFKELFSKFERHFEYEKPSPYQNVRYSFFKWGDTDYDEFMMDLMQLLTPRRYSSNEIIYHELD